MLAEATLGSPLEDDLRHLFERPSVIIFISGRRGSGKTDMALLIAELLKKLDIIHEYASNIKVLESPITFQYITDLETLNSWLKGSRARKLFILDEAGKAIRRRSPMSHMNLGILDDLQVIRHYRSSLILIAPGEQYIDRAALGSDILDIWIHKWSFRNPKVAVWHDLMEDEDFELKNIPATSIHYDSFDVAPFTHINREQKLLSMDAKTKFLWDWSHGMTSKELGVDSMTVYRRTTAFIKEILEQALSPSHMKA
jgi:hypothetical protein